MESLTSTLKLNRNVIIEILKMLESKDIFKLGLNTLSKKIYLEMGLT
jgi:hypothetical protein